MIQQSRPTISSKEIEAVSKVLKSGDLSEGLLTKRFEQNLSAYIGCKYAVALNSGTSALISLFLALDISSGDEVIIPAYTCSSVYHAVKAIGAVPVMSDVNLKKFSVDKEEVKKRISSKTKVIVVVHNFGIAADMGLLDLKIPIIEDCANSIGGSYKKRKLGSFGIASMYSFYATKMLTTGEGGAVLTTSKDIYDRIKEIKISDSLNVNVKKHFNFRFTDVQAAIGLKQLASLDKFIKKRRTIAKQYDEVFKKIDKVNVPQRDYDGDTFYRYIVQMKSRKMASRFIRKTNMNGVVCDRPLMTPPFLFLKDSSEFINSKIAYDRLVSVPIYPSLSSGDVDFIVSKCKKALQ